ncbi:hypothetical protein G4B11_002469 [Aspergillus flavus]|nr:hypothetical protein G4B11_002469 [Aspergillus flavus]
MNPVMKSETSAAVPQSQTEGYDRDSSFQQLLGAADIDNEDQHGSQSAITLRMWVIGVAFSIIGSALGHFGASTHILYWELGSVLGATLVQKEGQYYVL